MSPPCWLARLLVVSGLKIRSYLRRITSEPCKLLQLYASVCFHTETKKERSRGDTGTGKTSVVQHVGRLLGREVQFGVGSWALPQM